MKYIALTFTDPASNLACDEALLESCEQKTEVDGILRIWEPQSYFVVLGYSNKLATEVNPNACAERGIPILRRFSGGGAVLQGPGCLNYALVIKNARSGIYGDVAESYQRVLQRHQRLCQGLISEAVKVEGISDLAVAGRKISGNAQHRKHRYSLVHGSFLLNVDLGLMETFLHMPSRQPSYRQRRSHQSFLRNILVDSGSVREGLKKEWRVDAELQEVPYKRIDELVRNRYSRSDWNQKF
jgi:lipoate-protein ligase A